MRKKRFQCFYDSGKVNEENIHIWQHICKSLAANSSLGVHKSSDRVVAQGSGMTEVHYYRITSKLKWISTREFIPIARKILPWISDLTFKLHFLPKTEHQESSEKHRKLDELSQENNYKLYYFPVEHYLTLNQFVCQRANCFVKKGKLNFYANFPLKSLSSLFTVRKLNWFSFKLHLSHSAWAFPLEKLSRRWSIFEIQLRNDNHNLRILQIAST